MSKQQKERPLTERDREFCAKLLVHNFNATEAYLAAGFKCSRATARVNASKKLTKTNIQAEISRLVGKVAKKREMEVEDVYRLLSDIAQADITDFVTFKTEKVLLEETEDGEKIYAHQRVIELKDSSQVDGRLIHSIRQGADGSFTFKLHDKGSALNMLGKFLEMFTENVNVRDKTAEETYNRLLQSQDTESLSNDAYGDEPKNGKH